MFTTILNDVLGPVMRGPSSSHTAGSSHIGLVARQLLGAGPRTVRVIFDRNGSYGSTYVQQGVDLAFATGLMGWKQTDEIFTTALSEAEQQGVRIEFELQSIAEADHPNYVILEMQDQYGKKLEIRGKSVGGGTFIITRVDGAKVALDGKKFETLITAGKEDEVRLKALAAEKYPDARVQSISCGPSSCTMQLSSASAPPAEKLQDQPWVRSIRQSEPVYYTQKGEALFLGSEEMIEYAESHGCSLGEAALAYESTILGITREKAMDEMIARYSVMKQSVARGLQADSVKMLLLEPMAGRIMESVKRKKVAIGGIHAKAAAASMAAMHTCNSQGVVCAAPTGGAAGTLPGILTALEEEFGLSERQTALLLYAAGAIGLILAMRSTFAAEVAGCQVEIGAAGAMGSAAVVEFAGGSARQACDAAAISFQNTMGLVCDLVQGMCELPCHTRNAIAASSAFTNADMVLGGYVNHIDLDQTIDAVHSSGLMLPAELRCTAKGGLALAPSAIHLRGTGRRR